MAFSAALRLTNGEPALALLIGNNKTMVGSTKSARSIAYRRSNGGKFSAGGSQRQLA